MIFLFPTLFLILNPFQSKFLPPAYSPALIYVGRERGWWVTCNYPSFKREKHKQKQKEYNLRYLMTEAQNK
jgi:hypothetical protein